MARTWHLIALMALALDAVAVSAQPEIRGPLEPLIATIDGPNDAATGPFESFVEKFDTNHDGKVRADPMLKAPLIRSALLHSILAVGSSALDTSWSQVLCG